MGARVLLDAFFEQAGDGKTASILRKIYHDEISHVNYGLTWFRRWKSPNDSDWEAYGKQLDFPLSPSRAKANGAPKFNVEGRRDVGLDENFIRQLQSFERSKGRTPNVFWFCPDAENAMAHGLEGAGYEPKDAVAKLRADLEILPAFLASRDDVVLVDRVPSLEHRERLQ